MWSSRRPPRCHVRKWRGYQRLAPTSPLASCHYRQGPTVSRSASAPATSRRVTYGCTKRRRSSGSSPRSGCRRAKNCGRSSSRRTGDGNSPKRSGLDYSGVRVYHAPELRESYAVTCDGYGLSPTAFSADGKLLVRPEPPKGDKPFSFVVVDLETGAVRSTLHVELKLLSFGMFHRIAFTADGKWVYSNQDDRVLVWEVATGQIVTYWVWTGTGAVDALGSTADGRFIRVNAGREYRNLRPFRHAPEGGGEPSRRSGGRCQRPSEGAVQRTLEL